MSPSNSDSVSRGGRRPERIGRYLVEGLIGTGGFGDVYRALDPQLNRVVAIKVCRSDDENVVREFKREAQRLAQLSHRNIVPVHDTGTWEGRPYLVMEYVGNGNLEQWLLNRVPRPSYDQIARLVGDAADALAFIHRQNIVHRDVKPRNILVQETDEELPTVYLSDFGLATSEHEQLQERPSILGTEAYMAPEQAAGKSHALDGRADIYSLGVVLFKLLTGRLPYDASSREEYRKQLRRAAAPPSPTEFAPEVPAELAAICQKCMAKRPSDRYLTAEDLANDLRRFADRYAAHRAALETSLALPSTMTGDVAGHSAWQRLRRVQLGPLVVSIGLSVVAALAFYWGEHFLATRRSTPHAPPDSEGNVARVFLLARPVNARFHNIETTSDSLLIESQGLTALGLAFPQKGHDLASFHCVVHQARATPGVAILFDIARIEDQPPRYTAFAFFLNADESRAHERLVSLDQVTFTAHGEVTVQRTIARGTVAIGDSYRTVSVELVFREGRPFDVYIDRQVSAALHDALLELRGNPAAGTVVAPVGVWVQDCTARVMQLQFNGKRVPLRAFLE